MVSRLPITQKRGVHTTHYSEKWCPDYPLLRKVVSRLPTTQKSGVQTTHYSEKWCPDYPLLRKVVSILLITQKSGVQTTHYSEKWCPDYPLLKKVVSRLPTTQKSGVGSKVKDGPQSANVREDIRLYQCCMFTGKVLLVHVYIVQLRTYCTAQNVLYKFTVPYSEL